METNWRLIWIVMAPGRLCKFHAPPPAHKLLTVPMSTNTHIAMKMCFLLIYMQLKIPRV